jgi:uncharacterized protein (TIGR00369 family)
LTVSYQYAKKEGRQMKDFSQSEQEPEEKLNIKLGVAPNLFVFMQGRMIDFNGNERLTIAFPVLESYLNPGGSMQGGFITAAFDNVFGPLCQAVTGTKATTTVDLYTNYHRPIFAGDELVITASIIVKGKTKIHMTGAAYNQANQLIATASTNYIYLKAPRSGA